ncbi:MAG: hypothetical protein HYX24_06395 [Candidatus Aenigmarchaeota archaeon]|nr:hypothetical protein [Candidatus Aenigmarchaeota archaeon]
MEKYRAVILRWDKTEGLKREPLLYEGKEIYAESFDPFRARDSFRRFVNDFIKDTRSIDVYALPLDEVDGQYIKLAVLPVLEQ